MRPLYENKKKVNPKAKRRIRQNIWGNWIGYAGRERWEEFGPHEFDAKYWLDNGVRWQHDI